MKEIYEKYGNYIIESSYENTDELDSVSLYNQAITYFQEQKRPKASYNLEVISNEALDLIGLPNLRINSKIRIYEPSINLNDNNLDSISYNNNELIVTGINYELRNPDILSLSVEQLNNYQKLLEKLLISIKNK